MQTASLSCHDRWDLFSSSGSILQSPLIPTLGMSKLMPHHTSTHQVPNPCPLTTFNQRHISSVTVAGTSTVESNTSRSFCIYPVGSSKSYVYIYSIWQTRLSRVTYRRALQPPLKTYPHAQFNKYIRVWESYRAQSLYERSTTRKPNDGIWGKGKSLVFF